MADPGKVANLKAIVAGLLKGWALCPATRWVCNPYPGQAFGAEVLVNGGFCLMGCFGGCRIARTE